MTPSETLAKAELERLAIDARTILDPAHPDFLSEQAAELARERLDFLAWLDLRNWGPAHE
jgi:hypothetical protein